MSKIKIEGLQEYQREIIEFEEKNTRQGRMIAVKSPRQMGKTTCISVLLITSAILHPKTTGILLSLTYKNLNEIFCNILKRFNKIIKSSSIVNSVIELVNGSRILFLSAANRDSLRGFTAESILVYDESAFIPDKVIDDTLPFANRYNANVYFFSTPLFRTGRFYEMWTNEEVKHFDWSAFPNPFITQEKLETLRKSMPLNVYLSEYLGKFIDYNSTVFGDFSQILKDVEYNGEKVYAGIDWGTGNNGDYTSISVFNMKKEMVDIYYFNDKSDTQAIDEIISFLSKFHVVKIIVEVNSIGRVYLNLLKKKTSIPIVEFNTTNDTKREIIESLVSYINNREITLINEKELLIQMAGFEIQRTSTGKITYAAQSNIHDDLVLSTAICLHLFKKGNYVLGFV